MTNITGTLSFGTSKEYVDNQINNVNARIDGLTGSTMNPHVFSNFGNQSMTKALSQNTPAMITNDTLNLWDAVDSHFHLFTYSADTFIVQVPAHYLITGTLSFRSVNGGGEYKISLMKNGVEVHAFNAEATASGFYFTVPFVAGLELDEDDAVHFEFTNTSNGNDITIINGSLSIHSVHLTS